MNPGIAVASIQTLLATRYPDNAAAVITGPAAKMAALVFFIQGMTRGMLWLTVLALLLSATGLANSFWLETIRRRQEFGIRRTQGASAVSIFWQVQRSALAIVLAAGIGATAVAWLAVRLASSILGKPFLFQWIWILWSVVAIVAAAGLGGGIPALWAARAAPAEMIRTGRQ